jgi:hypothetical protein
MNKEYRLKNKMADFEMGYQEDAMSQGLFVGPVRLFMLCFVGGFIALTVYGAMGESTITGADIIVNLIYSFILGMAVVFIRFLKDLDNKAVSYMQAKEATDSNLFLYDEDDDFQQSQMLNIKQPLINEASGQVMNGITDVQGNYYGCNDHK